MAAPSAAAPVLLPQAHSISSANMTKKGSELFRAGTSCLSDISPLYRAAAVLTTKKAPCRARNAAAYIKRDIEDAVPYRRLAAFIRRAGPVCPAEECALSVWADRVARPYRRSTQRRQKGKQHSQSKCCFLVGDGGFEPPKALPADLQSVPFGHSGNPPYEIGAGGRIRTPDLLITNQLLYQLSYTSISPANRIITEVF